MTSDELLRCKGESVLDEVDYWVYVLRCRDRYYYDDYKDLKRRAEKRLDREPDWLRQAWEAYERLYVGQTEDLEKRLGQHFNKPNSTDFTTLFEPVEVDSLFVAWTRNSAERKEQKVARRYYADDKTYAYWG